MCLEILPNTGHILNPKYLNYALEELQPIPNRNAVVCLQAMKFGLKGVIMYCKYSELEVLAENKTIMQQPNYRWSSTGGCRMDRGCSAIPQGNEARGAAPKHSVALQEESDCLKRYLGLFDV